MGAQKPESSSLPCTLRKCKNECRGSNNCYVWTPDDYKLLGCKISKLEQQQQQQQLLGRTAQQQRPPPKSRTLGDTSMQIFAVTDVDGNTVFASTAVKSGEHINVVVDDVDNDDNTVAAIPVDRADVVVDVNDDDTDADNGYDDNELQLLMSAIAGGTTQAAANATTAAPSTSSAHPLACTTYSQTSPVQFHDEVPPIEQPPTKTDGNDRDAASQSAASAAQGMSDAVMATK